MTETYPVPPLTAGHALAIGVTSYDGSVFYGITADRDLLPDADVLGQCVTEALDELLDTATGARPAPRGAARAAPAPKAGGRRKPPTGRRDPLVSVRDLRARDRRRQLADLVGRRAVVPADAERYVAPDSTEESEYAALMEAAVASRRAADRPLAAGSWWSRRSAPPTGRCRCRDVVAVHADPEERPLGADPEDDLAWYATQEIEDLLAGF